MRVCQSIDSIFSVLLRSVFFLLLSGLSTVALPTGSGLAFQLPLVGKGKSTHLIAVDEPLQKIIRPGYRTVFVDVTRLSTDLSQPETITVGSSANYYAQSSKRFSTSFTIPAGQTSAQIELDYPWSGEYGRGIVVSNDGSLSTIQRQSLLAQIPENYRGGFNSTSEEEYNFLYITADPAAQSTVTKNVTKVIDDEQYGIVMNSGMATPVQERFPSFHTLSTLIRQIDVSDNSNGTVVNYGTENTSQQPALDSLRNYRHLVSVTAERIPSSPVGLQCIDFVIADVGELQKIAQKMPEKTESLRKWVASGGVLVINNCGEDFSGLPSILPNLSAHQKPSLDVNRIQQWLVPSGKVDGTMLANRIKNLNPSADDNTNLNYGYGYSNVNESPPPFWLNKIHLNLDNEISGRRDNLAGLIAKSEATLAVSKYGLGRVIAVPTDMVDYSEADWAILLASSYPDNQATVSSNFGSRNLLFGKISGFQVPNVGEPPKVSFLGLITLFAMVVGPVTFIWLNRINRLNLLLFLIPGFSLLSVMALIGYVMIADGFAFRSNRISVTHLDSLNQVATTETIQAIYTGSTPRSYTVPRDVAFSTNSHGENNRLNAFESRDEVTFSGGRIAVRTKHHVTTFQVENSGLSLALNDAEGGKLSKADNIWDRELEIKNNLPVNARLIVVRAKDRILIAENVAAGSSAKLTDSGVTKLLRELYLEVKTQTQNNKSMYEQPDYYYYNSRLSKIAMWDGMQNNQQGYVGMLGTKFANIDQLERLDVLKPGDFYCFCDDSPFAVELKPDATYVYQMHLFHGQCVVE